MMLTIDKRAILKEIKTRFNREGITDEVSIAQYIAFLLLIRDKWDALISSDNGSFDTEYQRLQADYSKEIIPLPPPSLSPKDILNLMENLKNEDIGDFFQRYVRFDILLSRQDSRSQYPTPHHIATWMAELSITSETKVVADFTSGTGGLLVAAYKQNPNIRILVTDFSPEYTRLTFANLRLNGVTNLVVHNANAITVIESNDFDDWQPDSILMNPPFDDKLTSGSGKIENYGSKRPTVLAGIALEKLNSNGILAILQPEGLFFGNSVGEQYLRKQLMDNHFLEAVITLPKEAMIPYSAVASHLIIVQKKSHSNEPIWFMSLNADGYGSSQGRDLTAEANLYQSDLPRARDLVLKTRSNDWESCIKIPNIGDVQTTQLGSQLGGVGVRIIGPAPNDIRWDVAYFDEGVLVRVFSSTNSLYGWFYDAFGTGMSLTFSSDHISVFNWNEIKPHQKSSVEKKYDLGNGDASISVENNKIKFQNIRKKSATKSHLLKGLIIDVEGLVISEWLNIEEADKLPDAPNFQKETGAVAIQDAKYNPIGWLIGLASGNKSATLLLVNEDKSQVFQKDGKFYILCDSGWLEIELKANKIDIKLGQRVSMSSNFPPRGFALGKNPYISSYSLFGVLIARSQFTDETRAEDMRPSRFFPEPEVISSGRPTELLATIRERQAELLGRMNYLEGILGQSGNNYHLEDKLANMESLELLLDSKQKNLFDIIKGQNNALNLRFDLSDIKKWCDYNQDEIRQCLTVYLGLGLIKAVHDSAGHNRYRLIFESDINKKG